MLNFCVEWIQFLLFSWGDDFKKTAISNKFFHWMETYKNPKRNIIEWIEWNNIWMKMQFQTKIEVFFTRPHSKLKQINKTKVLLRVLVTCKIYFLFFQLVDSLSNHLFFHNEWKFENISCPKCSIWVSLFSNNL